MSDSFAVYAARRALAVVAVSLALSALTFLGRGRVRHPGHLRLIPGAVDRRNFPVLMAIVIVGSVLVVVANAIVDVTLAALDPRVRA